MIAEPLPTAGTPLTVLPAVARPVLDVVVPVYNEERDTLTPRFPSTMNRAFIVKVNRLFRY